MTAPLASLLIVEDDPEISRLLADFLQREGFEVECADSGKAMDAVLQRMRPDLLVLDLMLPGEDGLSICRRLRADDHIPILMLTAKSDEIDRVVGLEMGADDYLTKPFAPRELLARIRAVLRRTRMLPPNMRGGEPMRVLSFGDWQLDTVERNMIDSAGTMVALSGAEYRLLRVFLDYPQRVLNRDQLLNLTQGRETDVFDRSIDLLVSRLRQRLRDDAREPRYIKTVRSEGYVFASTVEPRSALARRLA